jgi:DNA-binding NarL/FixJ family response regulator
MNKIRILLVDDHGVVREGIKRLLERQPDFEVVDECDNGEQALTRIEKLQPHVVMMDLSMPGMSGLDVTRRAKALGSSSRIIALTVHEDEGYVREALNAGARGYLLKRTPPELIPKAVKTVNEGGIFIDPAVSDAVVKAIATPYTSPSASPNLSEREAAVVRAIALGYSNKEIGAQLRLSVKTVETYKARAMEKLGLTSRVDIVRYAQQRGWMS